MTDPTPDTDPNMIAAVAARAELEAMIAHLPPAQLAATRDYVDALEVAIDRGLPTAVAEAVLTSARSNAILEELAAIRIELAGMTLAMTPGTVAPQRAAAIRLEVIERVEVAALTEARSELVETYRDDVDGGPCGECGMISRDGTGHVTGCSRSTP